MEAAEAEEKEKEEDQEDEEEEEEKEEYIIMCPPFQLFVRLVICSIDLIEQSYYLKSTTFPLFTDLILFEYH